MALNKDGEETSPTGPTTPKEADEQGGQLPKKQR